MWGIFIRGILVRHRARGEVSSDVTPRLMGAKGKLARVACEADSPYTPSLDDATQGSP